MLNLEYVQLEASKDLLDRAGYKAVDKVMHSVAGNIKVSIDLREKLGQSAELEL